jgi:hypothetical protein
VVEDVYHTAAAPADHGARTNSGARHDKDILGLGLDTTTDVLEQLDDAPDPTQPS